MYGGAAPNPLVALAQIIAQLKDAAGHILIPHFYDRVAAPSDAELKAWKALPFDEEHYRETEVGSTVLTARLDSRFWNAPGRGPRWTYTGLREGSRARGRRL